jgi:hypothetical protein
MATTNFPDGVTSFGVPVLPAGISPFAKVWFLDAKSGSNGGDGRSPDSALKTMAQVFTVIRSGDVIYTRGKIAEQLSTPVGVFDVTIIGAANRPRHADNHTESDGKRGSTGSTWVAPSSPTAATPLLTVKQQGWKLANILFDGPSDAAAVQLFRDGGADDAERDASHAQITGCKFVAGQNHIEFKGGLSQVVLDNNDFFGATGASLLNTTGAGIGTNNFYIIQGNRFNSNASHIVMPTNYATISGNRFGKFTTAGIDLRSGSENVVTENSLYGTYSNVGGYFAGTNDEWGGNMNVISGGWTAADPA